MEERFGATTFLHEPLTLLGNEIKAGDTPSGFQAVTPGLDIYSLDHGKGAVRLVAAVPSLDTPVCDAEIRRLSEEVEGLDNVLVLVVSADLPFAQDRWRRESGIDNVTFLSDHRELSFGKAFGITVKELRLLARAIFVLDSENQVTYAQYVRELTDHPDYEAALAAVRQTADRQAV